MAALGLSSQPLPPALRLSPQEGVLLPRTRLLLKPIGSALALFSPDRGHWPCPMRRSKSGRVGTLISKGKTNFTPSRSKVSPLHPQHCRSHIIVPCPFLRHLFGPLATSDAPGPEIRAPLASTSRGAQEAASAPLAPALPQLFSSTFQLSI